MLNNPATVLALERKHNINKNFVDIPYSPIIQSGGVYDLRLNIFDNLMNFFIEKRPNAESDSKPLEYDAIVCMCGGKYFNYNTNIVRTLFIDPTNVLFLFYNKNSLI